MVLLKHIKAIPQTKFSVNKIIIDARNCSKTPLSLMMTGIEAGSFVGPYLMAPEGPYLMAPGRREGRWVRLLGCAYLLRRLVVSIGLHYFIIITKTSLIKPWCVSSSSPQNGVDRCLIFNCGRTVRCEAYRLLVFNVELPRPVTVQNIVFQDVVPLFHAV